MYTLLVLLFILICILMVSSILLQSSKGDGLAGSLSGMGGSGGVLGSRGAASFLQKVTVVLGVVYIVLCVSINKLGSNENKTVKSVTQEQLNTQQQSSAPSALPGNDILTPADSGSDPIVPQIDSSAKSQ